jgi:LPLT family lysophospholipid transporter-like MFS transporter
VLGAAAAGIWISLETTNRALIGGLLLGPAILAMAGTTSLMTAALVMVVIGFCGGLFVVPLNALLQETGHHSVGAGNALAVQNFAENLAMLLFIGTYSMANAMGVPVVRSVRLFGLVLFVAVLGIAMLRAGQTAGASRQPLLGVEKEQETFEEER